MSEPLFNPIESRMVISHDLYGNELKRDLRNFKFRVGVYGILLEGKKILVQRHPELKSYGLPGGGVEIGETIEEALIREFKEETGLDVKVGKLVTVTEDFFTYYDKDAHSVSIAYQVEKTGGKLLVEGNNDDVAEVKLTDLKDLTADNTQRMFWTMIGEIKGL